MIYCNLKGGLGNILFQIAATKSFSIKKNTDCSFPNFLNQLNNINEDNFYNPKINYSLEYKKFLHLKEDRPNTNINLYNFPFNYTDFIPEEENFFIDGFFQSEKYFSKHTSEILDFFKPSEDILNLIYKKYNFILESNCTSIHVRRGDYVKLQSHHPVQTIEYYENCVKYIKNYDMIIVFSDDITWCKENFKFKNMFFVENEKDYIELFLMSFCKNNITSNSSFSWWGAWLNKNKNKQVIMPKNWFGPALSHLDCSDIYIKNSIIL